MLGEAIIPILCFVGTKHLGAQDVKRRIRKRFSIEISPGKGDDQLYRKSVNTKNKENLDNRTKDEGKKKRYRKLTTVLQE